MYAIGIVCNWNRPHRGTIFLFWRVKNRHLSNEPEAAALKKVIFTTGYKAGSCIKYIHTFFLTHILCVKKRHVCNERFCCSNKWWPGPSTVCWNRGLRGHFLGIKINNEIKVWAHFYKNFSISLMSLPTPSQSVSHKRFHKTIKEAKFEASFTNFW